MSIRLLSLTLIVFCLAGCNTKPPQFGVTHSEISEMLADYDQTDLYTAVSLAQLAFDVTSMKMYLLEKLGTDNPGYVDQMNYLKGEYEKRKKYLDLLYKKVEK